MKTITKEDFRKYEEIQLSGSVNMFDIKGVMSLSGLTSEQIKEIHKNYSKFVDKWGVKR